MFAALLLLMGDPAPPWTLYFPVELTGPVGECYKQWYRPPPSDEGFRLMADFYRSIDEPPLKPDTHGHVVSGDRQLRFTWSRTFNAPIIIRAVLPNKGPGRLIAKRMSGQGGYEWGKVKDNIDRELSPREVRQIVKLTNDKTAFPPFKCEIPGTDGAGWNFEAVENGQFRYASLSNLRSGIMREIGVTLLAMSGWTEEEIY